MKQLCIEDTAEEAQALVAMLQQHDIGATTKDSADEPLFSDHSAAVPRVEVWVEDDELFERAWALLNTTQNDEDEVREA